MTCIVCSKDLTNTHKYLWLSDMEAAICYHCFLRRHQDLIGYISKIVLSETLFNKGGVTDG